jgi:hypothetical protein
VLDLAQLSLVVDDLLDHRAARLVAEAPRAAAFYLPLLARRRAELARYAARGPAVRRPFARELADAAARQDAHARALVAHLDAVAADDAVRAEVTEAARRVRDALLAAKPGRGHQARASLPNRLAQRLPAVAADLAALPPLPSGTPVADRVQAWLAESAVVDGLLTARADARHERRAGSTPKDLHGRTLALLCRLRAALADERLVAPVPADLEAFVFARLDALRPRRGAAGPHHGQDAIPRTLANKLTAEGRFAALDSGVPVVTGAATRPRPRRDAASPCRAPEPRGAQCPPSSSSICWMVCSMAGRYDPFFSSASHFLQWVSALSSLPSGL